MNIDEAWKTIADADYTLCLEPPSSDREVAVVTLSRPNPAFGDDPETDGAENPEYLMVLCWGAPSIEEAIRYAAEIVERRGAHR